MSPIKSGYLTDRAGERQAMVVSLDEWRALLNELEGLSQLLGVTLDRTRTRLGQPPAQMPASPEETDSGSA